MSTDFRRLFESAPALFMVLAADPPRFTIVAASDAYLRAVKHARAGFIGLPVFEALPPSPEDESSRQNSSASFQRVIDLRVPDTMPVQRHDILRPESEGGGYETRYWSAVNSPVLGDDGEVRYILHRVEDVTEFVVAQEKGAEQEALAHALRSRAEEMEAEISRRTREIEVANRKLREANTRLSELDRAKSVFFSNASHELRTPLTLILGTLEELLAAPAGGGDRAGLEAAHRSALRLLRLVNGLLEFSRIEGGRADPRYRPTDVGSLTGGLAGAFGAACERAGLRLVVDCPSSPTPVLVDQDAWEKIVVNLVSNALKYTWTGEIVVRVREVDGGCELRVRDTGVGIPEDELPRIFERFHRVASTHGRSVEGSGIGLALVQELVRLHAGTITVESAPGRGSTFVVHVPLGAAHLPRERIEWEGVPAPPTGAARRYAEEALGWEGSPTPTPIAAPPPAPERAGPAPERAGPAPRPRVLLAEDNADMRAYVTRLLSARFEVEAVADGQAALEAARRARPDLVLTDVMMPRLDGLGLLRALRSDAELRTVPVVMLSARAGDEAEGEGLEAGADDYLVKPFSARELIARVGANVKLARMRVQVERAAGRAEALEETDRRKNQFLAMLSHELRNPLAPIRNCLYILERAVPGGEQARRAQDTIDRQVGHLARMVEDLLDVSRITQGKMQLQQERLDLVELVRRSVEDARASFERAGVSLEVQLAGEPLIVHGDVTRLAQVVGNLLGNAVKFTPRGGRVTLALAPHEDVAVLEVQDDGAGMPPDVVEHLFQPFVQADRTVDRAAGGLGLGLAVVKGIVELHGGAVAGHSAGPGTGTRMTVKLPLREHVRPHLAVVRAVAPSRAPLRVLIIEDNRDAARSLQEVLELEGHEVRVAEHGRAGISLARSATPDAIICDIGLPEMDGYAVAEAIRADPALRDVCLVAVTGYAAFDDRERSRGAGFDHHLAKPPDLEVLGRVLEECGGRSAAHAP